MNLTVVWGCRGHACCYSARLGYTRLVGFICLDSHFSPIMNWFSFCVICVIWHIQLLRYRCINFYFHYKKKKKSKQLAVIAAVCFSHTQKKHIGHVHMENCISKSDSGINSRPSGSWDNATHWIHIVASSTLFQPNWKHTVNRKGKLIDCFSVFFSPSLPCLLCCRIINWY